MAESNARTTEASTERWTARLIPSLANGERVQTKLGMSRLLTQILSGHCATRQITSGVSNLSRMAPCPFDRNQPSDDGATCA